MFKDIVKKLSQLGPIWTEVKMTSVFPSLGLELFQKVGKRRTFKDASGMKYSAYLDESGEVRFIEVTLDVFLNPEELSVIEYEEKLKEFRVKFSDITAEVQEVLGTYSLFDSSSVLDMPYEQNALKMAVWQLPEMLFMVELKHEDRELPIRICIVLEPGSRD